MFAATVAIMLHKGHKFRRRTLIILRKDNSVIQYQVYSTTCHAESLYRAVSKLSHSTGCSHSTTQKIQYQWMPKISLLVRHTTHIEYNTIRVPLNFSKTSYTAYYWAGLLMFYLWSYAQICNRPTRSALGSVTSATRIITSSARHFNVFSSDYLSHYEISSHLLQDFLPGNAITRIRTPVPAIPSWMLINNAERPSLSWICVS